MSFTLKVPFYFEPELNFEELSFVLLDILNGSFCGSHEHAEKIWNEAVYRHKITLQCYEKNSNDLVVAFSILAFTISPAGIKGIGRELKSIFSYTADKKEANLVYDSNFGSYRLEIEVGK